MLSFRLVLFSLVFSSVLFRDAFLPNQEIVCFACLVPSWAICTPSTPAPARSFPSIIALESLYSACSFQYSPIFFAISLFSLF